VRLSGVARVARKVELWDSSVNRAQKRVKGNRPRMLARQSFSPITKIQKGCYFFSSLRKPAGNSLKGSDAADYFAPVVATTERKG